MLLLRDYPGSRLVGHRDLSPDLNGNGEIEPEEWVKECPCFNAADDFAGNARQSGLFYIKNVIK